MTDKNFIFTSGLESVLNESLDYGIKKLPADFPSESAAEIERLCQDWVSKNPPAKIKKPKQNYMLVVGWDNKQTIATAILLSAQVGKDHVERDNVILTGKLMAPKTFSEDLKWYFLDSIDELEQSLIKNWLDSENNDEESILRQLKELYILPGGKSRFAFSDFMGFFSVIGLLLSLVFFFKDVMQSSAEMDVFPKQEESASFSSEKEFLFYIQRQEFQTKLRLWMPSPENPELSKLSNFLFLATHPQETNSFLRNKLLPLPEKKVHHFYSLMKFPLTDETNKTENLLFYALLWAHQEERYAYQQYLEEMIPGARRTAKELFPFLLSPEVRRAMEQREAKAKFETTWLWARVENIQNVFLLSEEEEKQVYQANQGNRQVLFFLQTYIRYHHGFDQTLSERFSVKEEISEEIETKEEVRGEEEK